MKGEAHNKILIDTCFLISLVNEDDPQHENAEEYFRYFISEGITLVLSTIVLTEFQDRQPKLEILENFQVAVFGVEESNAHREHFSRSDTAKQSPKDKDGVKDDTKIIATALANGISTTLSVNSDFIRMAKKRGLENINYQEPLSSYLGQLPLK